jgi:hypothetical protein
MNPNNDGTSFDNILYSMLTIICIFRSIPRPPLMLDFSVVFSVVISLPHAHHQVGCIFSVVCFVACNTISVTLSLATP